MATGAWIPDVDWTILNNGEAVREEVAPCGSGTIATGIIGGYGALVDRIGLLCTAYQDPRAPTPEAQPKAEPEAPKRDAPLPVNNRDTPLPVGGGSSGGGGGTNGRANSEVTAYAQKFGKGQEVDYLEPGEAVTIIQCGNPEDWCEINAPVYGWVYAPQLDR
jgi:hypothetical protein